MAFAPPSQAHPGHPPDVFYNSIRVNVGAQYCLHPTGLYDSAPVDVAPCDPNRSNIWDIVYLDDHGDPDDHMYFIRVSGTNKCLTTPYWANYYAVLYTCYGFADQEWIHHTDWVEFPTGWVATLRNVAHNRCLTGPNWARGSVLLYDCQPYADQQWRVSIID